MASNASPLLIGPIAQLVTLRGLRDKGPLRDDELETIPQAGMVCRDGMIHAIGPFETLRHEGHETAGPLPGVVMPGMIDAHTHLCFGGSRARDYSLRIGGSSYQQILTAGGGIYDTVEHTRHLSSHALAGITQDRLWQHLRRGVTTCEVKSGYGLSAESEVKMLTAIKQAQEHFPGTVIRTCLAAHVPPREFDHYNTYLEYLVHDLFPLLKRDDLAARIDIFVEPEAFPPTPETARYLAAARAMGFRLTVHADQFTVGGSQLAVDHGADSADHLEVSGESEWQRLAAADTTATVLPGASLGLGLPFAPARKLLDRGCRLAIASDWNPGSAPMGDLLVQAALLGVYEKLTHAETWAALTVRAAKALKRSDCGVLAPGMRADFIHFPADDFREILYHQGTIKPDRIWTAGREINFERPR